MKSVLGRRLSCLEIAYLICSKPKIFAFASRRLARVRYVEQDPRAIQAPCN